MSDTDFRLANDESSGRLRALVESLTPEDYGRSVGGGWTVASVLGHVGFWDRWQAARWRAMLAGDAPGPAEDVVPAEHLANEALDSLWRLAVSSDVGRLAVGAAGELDALIAAAPPAIVEQIDHGTNEYLLRRRPHRIEHVEQIERALAGRA